MQLTEDEDWVDKVRRHLGKGDMPGHEFHGNQWTGGIGGGGSDKGGGTGRMPSFDATTIPRSDRPMSAEARTIETRFAEHIAHVGVDAALAEYAKLKDSQGGRVINTDTFRELSSDYRNDRSQSPAVHEPASWLAKQAYAAKLAEPIRSGQVLFTAGGAGAGKSSAIRDVPAVEAMQRHADVVFDTNMNTFSSSKSKIEQALASGRNVTIAYVGRDPVESLVVGALPRAMGSGGGRTVPLHEHANTHVGSAKVMDELRAHYANDPRVHFEFIDNTHGRGGAKLTDASLTRQLDYNDLDARLKTALDQEYANGRISERVYRGTLGKILGYLAGRVQKAVAGRAVAVDGAGDGRHAEPQHVEGRQGAGTRAEEVVRKFLNRGARP